MLLRARVASIGDRVKFTLVHAASVPTAGDYDLVAVFECIHDLPDPVGVLTFMAVNRGW